MRGEAPPGPESLPAGTFRIDREGAWRHEGQEVTHPGVVQSLYANLRVEGGAYYLQVGPARIPVDVEDTPFVVTRIEPAAGPADLDHALRIHLTDGSEEWLSLESVWIGRGSVPYCRVKRRRFSARLSVSAWLQLAPFLEEGPGAEEATLVVGGRRVPLPRQD